MTVSLLERLLNQQQDADIDGWVTEYLGELKDEDLQSLTIHLRAQEQALVFCNGEPPAPLQKTILGLRYLIETKGGDPKELLRQLKTSK